MSQGLGFQIWSKGTPFLAGSSEQFTIWSKGAPFIAAASWGNVAPTGIASAEAFGSPTITTGGVAVQPASIGSAEAIGSPVVTVAGGPVIVVPVGITSAEAVGSPTLTTGAVIITPTGITTGQAFGTLRIVLFVHPVTITSGESVGVPRVYAILHYSLEAVLGGAGVMPGRIAMVRDHLAGEGGLLPWPMAQMMSAGEGGVLAPIIRRAPVPTSRRQPVLTGPVTRVEP